MIFKDPHKKKESWQELGQNNNKDKELDNLEHISEKMNNIRQSFSSEIETSIKNFESIPKKVTVRVEYVKCGKRSCNSCSENEYYHQYFHYHYPHGPYYFAYYRDKENHGKLKKKYIGKIDPRNSYFKEFLDNLKNH